MNVGSVEIVILVKGWSRKKDIGIEEGGGNEEVESEKKVKI